MAQLIPIKPAVKGGTFPNSTSTTPVAVQLLSAALIADLNAVPVTKGDEFVNPAGRTYLVAYNTDATADHQVNLLPQGSPNGLVIEPYTVNIPKGSAVVLGAFDPNLFNSSGNAIRVGADVAGKVVAIVVQL